MPDINQLSLALVVILSFLSMFVCVAFIRAKGFAGVLALMCTVAIGIVVLVGLHGQRLIIGIIAAIIGIGIGGKVSDHRERRRLVRLSEAERKKRDAMMNSWNS